MRTNIPRNSELLPERRCSAVVESSYSAFSGPLCQIRVAPLSQPIQSIFFGSRGEFHLFSCLFRCRLAFDGAGVVIDSSSADVVYNPKLLAGVS